MRGLTIGAMALTWVGCSSTAVLRVRSEAPRPADAEQETYAVQVSCASFNLFTLAIPRECDRDHVVERELMAAARRAGAYRVEGLSYRATPDRGLWWLTRLLGVRRAKARALLLLGGVTPVDAHRGPPSKRARRAGGT